MKRFLLFLGDVCVLYLALSATIFIRYESHVSNQLDVNLVPFSFIFIFWVLIFYISNLYDINFTKNNLPFFSALLYSIAASAVVSLILFYLVPFLVITPRTNLFILTVAATGLLVLWRYGFNKLIIQTSYRNNTLIVGANQQSQELYDYMLANPQLGYNAIGILDVEDKSATQILEALIKQKNVSTIVLGSSAYKIPRIIDVFYGLLGLKINYYDLSSFYENLTGKVPLGAIDQLWFLENLSERNKGGYEMLKRSIDLLFAFVIGMVTLPFYPIIMLAIIIDSKGPIFLRQARIGKAGRVFNLIKFRTMITNAPDGSAEGPSGPVWASEHDPRVTRVGKLIRKTRIDEIPQVWNVLKGEESFVGPRPERPEFLPKLQEQIPFYKERYLVKPGLTGWAQIKHKLDFKGGMTVQDTAEKLQHDLYYIKNRSFMLDLDIVLRTVTILLKKFF